ncbi:hypothetical protein [Nocardia yamanashiensis]|uniref:hypothetical protein n=1 Tax=Nocardia yamanashiensis TaxID=209247 RepID=UPI000835298B|nr:hypothetical protein [Nocardia yamanashiensis]
MYASLIDAKMTIALGATIISVATIAFGGTFLLRVVTGGQEANDLQKSFFRAGHAHAGVLVILGLLLTVVGNAAGASPGWANGGALAVLVAAILMPVGFFLSVLGRNPVRPNRMIVSLWAGAALLVTGVLTSGITILAAGIDRM